MGYRHLIIGVTGNALDIDVLHFEQLGADLVLAKPLRLELLTKVLDYCLLHGTLSPLYSTTSSSSSSSISPNVGWISPLKEFLSRL